MFTSDRKESRIALIDFLNTMLELDGNEQIAELTIKNPVTTVDSIYEKPVEELTKKEMWALFFRYAADSSKRELIKNIIQKEEGIQMASKVLNEISKDEAERVAYIEHLIWTTDQESKIFYAEKRGKIEIAKNFLGMGLTIEQVAQGTGLSIEEVRKLL